MFLFSYFRRTRQVRSFTNRELNREFRMAALHLAAYLETATHPERLEALRWMRSLEDEVARRARRPDPLLRHCRIFPCNQLHTYEAQEQ